MPGADGQALILKDREDETSQLNRLGLAYSLLCLLPISAKTTTAFRRRTTISTGLQPRPSSDEVLTTPQLSNSFELKADD
jgi:hypothetical protein